LLQDPEYSRKLPRPILLNPPSAGAVRVLRSKRSSGDLCDETLISVVEDEEDAPGGLHFASMVPYSSDRPGEKAGRAGE
jgi:hypothetical protein